MGICIEKLPHTCGSRDGLQVFKKENGTYDGFCFSCGKYVPDPYKDKGAGYTPTVRIKTPEEIAQQIAEVSTYPTHDLTASRGLRIDALSYFGVRVGVSEYDGSTPTTVFFPYTKGGKLSGYKARMLQEKRMWSLGEMKDVDLFGWEQAKSVGAKRLYITEGEFDAIALYQILVDSLRNTKWANLRPAICSLPSGASCVEKVITRMAHDLRNLFEDVVFVPDMDEVGQAAADKFVRIFPNAKIAELPAKDVNECLMKGLSSEVANMTRWKSSKPKNTSLILGSSLREAARKQPVYGRPWPWRKLTAATKGRREGETYYFGAGVKMGKSELVDSLAAHVIVHDNLPVLMAKPEQAPARTYRNLIGKCAGRIFHDPDVDFDYEAFDKWEPVVGDKAIIVDQYQFINWEGLRDDIRHAVVAMGVKDVFIDPITCFTASMSASQTNEFLVEMTAELSAMAMDLSFIPYIFCHLKAPEGGKLPHERGGKVYSTQFTGSRAMMRSCHYMIGMEGNKDPELPEDDRNIRTLVILEAREFGASERVDLFWNKNTGLFTEI